MTRKCGELSITPIRPIWLQLNTTTTAKCAEISGPPQSPVQHVRVHMHTHVYTTHTHYTHTQTHILHTHTTHTHTYYTHTQPPPPLPPYYSEQQQEGSMLVGHHLPHSVTSLPLKTLTGAVLLTPKYSQTHLYNTVTGYI